jgi:hypothetical protein
LSALARAAGGAYARKVVRPEEVEEAVAQAFRVVREEKRAAVLDVCCLRGEAFLRDRPAAAGYLGGTATVMVAEFAAI